MSRQRIGILGSLAVAVGYLYAVGCGALTANVTGSSTGSDGTSSGSGTTVTVSGTITTPGASASASRSKGLGRKAIEDVAAAGLAGTLYDAVTGDAVGTFTTDSAGAYTVDCELEEHPESDSNASADDAIVTAQLALEAENADGSIHIETFVEVTVDPENPDAPITVNADSDTTIAAQALRSQFGIVAWGQGNAAAFVQGDPFCFFQLQHAVFASADTDSDGMADDLGSLKALLEGAMAGGDVHPADLGYENWGAVMQATLGGELPTTDADGDGVADALDALATAAAGATGDSADALLNNYSDGLSAMAILGTAFGDNMAGAMPAAANLAKGRHKTAATGGASACDTLTGSDAGDSSYLNVLVGSVMECEVEEGGCDEAYADPEGLGVLIATLDEFLAADNLAQAGLPFVLNSMLVTDGADGFDEYLSADGTTLDSTRIDGLVAICNTYDPALNEGQLEDWSYAMIQTVETQGWDTMFQADGTVDTGKMEFFGGYYDALLGSGDANTLDFSGIDYDGTAELLQQDFTELGAGGTIFGD
ncbi:MAG: hypothetical protein HY696_03310, partial [Deltaproteobacteria bacterium]|nr:hypothetical protein [Deltaproteobacteria bacterium]